MSVGVLTLGDALVFFMEFMEKRLSKEFGNDDCMNP